MRILPMVCKLQHLLVSGRAREVEMFARAGDRLEDPWIFGKLDEIALVEAEAAADNCHRAGDLQKRFAQMVEVDYDTDLHHDFIPDLHMPAHFSLHRSRHGRSLRCQGMLRFAMPAFRCDDG